MATGFDAAARRYDARRQQLRDTTTQLRREPLAAVGVTFVAGVIVGSLIGWFGHAPAPAPRQAPPGVAKA